MNTKDKPLHHLDLLMWNFDHPTGLTTITSMLFFEQKLQLEKVHKVLATRISKFSRFRSKVVHQDGHPTWHEDELFDIKSHVHHIALPGKGGDEELQVLISDLISSPLDYNKPLWQIHLIDNYKGGSALLWRVHHAIGDGASLMKVFLSLTDHYFEGIHTVRPIDMKPVRKHKNWLDKFADATHFAEDVIKFPKKIFEQPETFKSQMNVLKNSFKEMVDFATSSDNRDSIYKGDLGAVKKAAWSNAFSLKDLKRIGKHYGATVNETLLVILSGAIRKHMKLHHQDTSINFNVACPVDVRQNEQGIHLNNKVGVITINLPVEIESQEARFKNIIAKSKALKKSAEPAISFFYSQYISDYIPKKIEEMGAKYLGSKLMAVLSNVPGPKEELLFAGEPIRSMLFWLPHTYEMGMGLSVVSYNDTFRLGITVDANIVKDPDKIADFFEQEFHSLMQKIEN